MESKNDTFETKLAQLEKIVKDLGAGNLPLNESIDKFQAGMVLSNQLKTELSDANQKVAHLIDDQNQTTDMSE